MLPYVAPCCRSLHFDVLYCLKFLHVALCCPMLHSVELCCVCHSMLSCIALCCAMLPYVALFCYILPCVTVCCHMMVPYVAICCPILPYFSLCCSTLPNVALCCRKPGPNDRNISRQHIATLSDASCCARLATMVRRVAMCCDMLDVVGSNLKMVKFFTKHLWMLHDVAVVWAG